MKPTPILEELKIAAEAALTSAREVYPPTDTYDLMNEDVVPGINDAIKRHKQLEDVLSEIELWCQIDAKCDVSPTQEKRDERVKVLKQALKLVRK